MTVQLEDDRFRRELGRGWSPVQWLHLVYGVWVDQLWYWLVVRPHLQSRRQSWGLLAQSLLGALCVAGILLLLSVPALRAAGVGIDWKRLGLAMIVCIALLVVLASVSVLIGKMNTAAAALAGSGAFIAVAGLVVGIKFDLFLMGGATGGMSAGEARLVLLFAAYALFGINWGIVRCVSDGTVSRIEILFEGAILGLGIEDEPIAAILAAIGFWFLGAFLGGRWAGRQVRDPELQKQLASGDSSMFRVI